MSAIKARFPKSVRLLSPEDYSRVFGKAGRSVDNSFTVLYRVNERRQARLGLAISKKNSKRAVDRNLIKRTVRESFRLHQTELAGLDIVVLSRKGIVADKARLRASLEKHWVRLMKYLADS